MNSAYETLKEAYKKENISNVTLDSVLRLFDVFKKELGFESDEHWVSQEGITALESKSAVYTYPYHSKDKLIVEFIVNTVDKTVIDSFVRELQDKKIEWGIIATGNQYLLFNKDVKLGNGWKRNPVLLEVTMQGEYGKEYFEFFSCRNLFMEKKTLFFCDVINYRNQGFRGSENSWKTYGSSCKRYVKYIASQTYNYEDNIYDRLGLKDYINFIQNLKEDKGRTITTQSAIRNMYRHISGFMHFMAENNKEFYKGAHEVMDAFSNLKEKDIGNIYDEKHLSNVIVYLKSQKQGVRNLILFYLSLCFGLERNQLCNLKWSDIEGNYIVVDGRRKLMPNRLLELFKELEDENRKRNIQMDYIFYTEKGNKRTPVKEWTVNDIFSHLAKIDSSDEVYSQYVPANIRKTLAEYLLLETGADLIEVMDLLGIGVGNLGRYISDEVLQKAADKRPVNQHLLEKLINRIDGE